MEKMTSENIYRIEITETNLPAKVLKKEVKTENNNDYTKTITKLKRDIAMVKQTKTIIYFKPNKAIRPISLISDFLNSVKN